MVAGHYRHVRALARGLNLLAALNQLGKGTPAEIARHSGIDRTTAYRLLETLAQQGFIVRSASDERYRLTRAVRQLSDGFTERELAIQIAEREMRKLVPTILWPSDFAAFENGGMVIRETTHPYSPFSIHHAMVGRVRPLTRSALGRAVLAAVLTAERRAMLEMTVRNRLIDAAEAANWRQIQRSVALDRERGYSWASGGVEANMAGIALPVRSPDRVIGALNIAFFVSAITREEAEKRYLPLLSDTVAAIERDLANPESYKHSKTTTEFSSASHRMGENNS